MSTMALNLPMNYVNIDTEEMEYVDGGYYLSHSDCQSIDFAIGATAGMSAGSIAGLVSAAAGYVGTLVAASIPAVGWVLGAALTACILNQAGSIASALVSDMFRGRGIDITLGWWYGTPYASFSAR